MRLGLPIALLWAVLAPQLAQKAAAQSSAKIEHSQLPLHTAGRWIVDRNDEKVRLVCINWAGHLEALLPEGLAARPVDELAQFIADMGFNCVRLTYSVETILRRGQPASEAASEILTEASLKGLRTHNPWVWEASVWGVIDRTVEALARAQLMVIMDNHVTQAGWCCSLEDNQRWFTDELFWPEEWRTALVTVAASIRNATAAAELRELGAAGNHWRHVVGMGLRNELFPWSVPELLNATRVWYDYMGGAAAAVSAANPDLLIVAGGTFAAGRVSYVLDKPLLPPSSPSFHKIVYEQHFYNFEYVRPGWRFSRWLTCLYMRTLLDNFAAVVQDEFYPFAAPLWFSEFGLPVAKFDSSRPGDDDVAWFDCLAGWVEKNTLSWGYWAFQGQYYIREGVKDLEEPFSVVTANYSAVKNADFLARLQQLM